MDAEQRAVFQGIVYYYRENQVYCRYQAALRDAVDPALLQQALDAARPLAGYYFSHVVWQGREARLEPNDAPCRAAASRRSRRKRMITSFRSAGREIPCTWTGSISWPTVGAARRF